MSTGDTDARVDKSLSTGELRKVGLGDRHRDERSSYVFDRDFLFIDIDSVAQDRKSSTVTSACLLNKK